MKGLCTYSICLYSLANLCVASTCQTDPSEWTRWVRSGEPYSIAACNTSDPEARFQEEKAHLDDRASTALLMPAVLARTAMAALEAGLPGEAQSYAEQALVAATAPRYANARPVSFQSEAVGVATSLANVVLGRLALVGGNLAEAEERLLLSADAHEGFARFWGPNMTLALELLKHHRSETVLEFLERSSQVWQEPGAREHLATWTAAIRSGKIPDFGANLLYQ